MAGCLRLAAARRLSRPAKPLRSPEAWRCSTPLGLIIPDCLAVKRMWNRIRRAPESVANGVCLPCWLLLASAIANHPTARCAWMRSHRSAEEARLAGYPAAWHEGNAMADAAAKAEALAQDVPQQLLGSFRQHEELAERVASTVAAI